MYECILCFSMFLFFKHKTAYEMRISDWSSDVCSSDLQACARPDQIGGGADIDHSIGIQRQHHQRQRTTLGQLLPRQKVGVVFQGADDNLIARIEKEFQPIGQKIQRRSGAMAKDDLPAISCIDRKSTCLKSSH